jgi:hypothetical protein
MGTVLVAVRQRSVARMWMLALSSRSAHRLLYLAAVRDDRLSGPLRHNGQIGELRRTREPVSQHRPKDLQPLLAVRVALARSHAREEANAPPSLHTVPSAGITCYISSVTV